MKSRTAPKKKIKNNWTKTVPLLEPRSRQIAKKTSTFKFLNFAFFVEGLRRKKVFQKFRGKTEEDMTGEEREREEAFP